MISLVVWKRHVTKEKNAKYISLHRLYMNVWHSARFVICNRDGNVLTFFKEWRSLNGFYCMRFLVGGKF